MVIFAKMAGVGHSLARCTRLGSVSTRCFSSPSDLFAKAQADMKKLNEAPDVETKLKIYALFKQSSSGDVTGSRPGMMDFAGRAKYDAWAALKGTSQDQAKLKYADLINSLLGAEAAEAATSGSSATVDGLKPVDGLDITIEGKVFKITLNRPKKFNALTMDMYNGIIDALKASAANKSTSITVLAGAGDYYCSGNDLSNFAKAASATKAEVKEMAEMAGGIMQRYIDAYIDHPKPIIALINGPAIGISVTVLPLFELVLASDKSSFHTPFAQLGQSPEGTSSYTFPLLMGQLKAAEVLLFSKKLTAADAEKLGLVNEVIPHAEFATTTAKRVEALSKLPPETLSINKTLLRNIHRENLHKANVCERETIVERWQSKECAAAIAAFLTKSKK